MARFALVSESVAWVTWKVNFVSEIPVSLVSAMASAQGARLGFDDDHPAARQAALGPACLP